MKRLAALALAAASLGCAAGRRSPAAEAGQAAPRDLAGRDAAFHFEDAQGRKLGPEAFGNGKALVAFYATWSVAAPGLVKELDALAQEAGPSLGVFAIAIDEDRRKVAPFLSAHAPHLDPYFDRDARASDRELALDVVPTTLLVEGGRIRASIEGLPREGKLRALALGDARPSGSLGSERP